jgi:hypothetical protein
MPAPLTTVLLVLGAVLTSISPLAGCIVAGFGVLWQIVVTVAELVGGPQEPRG